MLEHPRSEWLFTGQPDIVLQNHLEEFLKQFKWLLSSREWFEDWKKQQEAGGLTDIQRAARYYYLQRHSFGGRVLNRSYGVQPLRPPQINLVRMEEELSAVHLRMTGVTIENLPWEEFIRRYDRSEVFFYIDPPYYKLPYYKHNLNYEDYQEMSETLSSIKGKFILSINDHQDMRETFKMYKIVPVKLKYSVSVGKQREGKELIIRNF